MFSFTLDIYCTSVRPGRGIPHMWLSLRFLLSFYLLKGFFSSLSWLLLRVKGRGCHTLLKPYETNCGLWIWAIQIEFDWLIDWLIYHHRFNSYFYMHGFLLAVFLTLERCFSLLRKPVLDRPRCEPHRDLPSEWCLPLGGHLGGPGPAQGHRCSPTKRVDNVSMCVFMFLFSL